MGLWPMGPKGPWMGGLGILPAAEMALEHINARTDILPGYRLNMIWNNTMVSLQHWPSQPMKQYYTLTHSLTPTHSLTHSHIHT